MIFLSFTFYCIRLRFRCHFLFLSVMYRTSHFKCLYKVSPHNNRSHSPNIYIFLNKLIIFNLKTAGYILWKSKSVFFLFIWQLSLHIDFWFLETYLYVMHDLRKAIMHELKYLKSLWATDKTKHIMEEESIILEWDSEDSYYLGLTASVYQQITLLQNISFTIIIYMNIGKNVSNSLFKED